MVENLLEKLSLREKIGQMLMFDFRKWRQSGEDRQSDYTEMSDEVRGLIRRHSLGNVILFAENFKSVGQIARLTRAFQCSVANGIPMLIGVDQEGGRVVRMNCGCSLPGNMALAASGNADNAYTAGLITGRELAAVGINADFAPDVDINNNPNNPVINVRSFSSDPSVTARFGAAMAKGLRDAGVADAVKHFPGHGNTDTDSHTGLPSVPSGEGELRAFELVPFAEAVRSGCLMVMSGHIQFPNIEKATVVSKRDGSLMTLPATLSHRFLTEILRDELGFEGVVITDSMQMQAISSHVGSEEANVLAIDAGVDILLMCTSLRSLEDEAKLAGIIDGIVRAVEDGRIPLRRIDESVLRVLRLKERLGLFEALAADEASASDEAAAVEKALSVVGCEAHRAAERLIAAEGVTVLKNDGVLPIETANKRTLLFAAYRNKANAFEFALNRLKAEGKLGEAEHSVYIYAGKTELDDEAKRAVDECDNLLVLTETEPDMAHSNWYVSFPRAVCDYAAAVGKKAVVISAFMPYDAVLYRDAAALLLCYCAKGVPAEVVGDVGSSLAYGVNVPAAFEVVLGSARARGRLTVDLPEMDGCGRFDTGAVVFPAGSGVDLN